MSGSFAQPFAQFSRAQADRGHRPTEARPTDRFQNHVLAVRSRSHSFSGNPLFQVTIARQIKEPGCTNTTSAIRISDTEIVGGMEFIF